jgi:hypothetical protein
MRLCLFFFSVIKNEIYRVQKGFGGGVVSTGTNSFNFSAELLFYWFSTVSDSALRARPGTGRNQFQENLKSGFSVASEHTVFGRLP